MFISLSSVGEASSISHDEILGEWKRSVRTVLQNKADESDMRMR